MIAYSEFALALKSTIDYYAKQIADARGLPFIDIASPEFDTAITESDQPAICWEFQTFSESPMDPMYQVDLSIGAMTMLDPSQYISLDITGDVAQRFRVGTTIPIMDYSGDTLPTERAGSLIINANGLAPQQSDKVTGIRFIGVSAKALRMTG